MDERGGVDRLPAHLHGCDDVNNTPFAYTVIWQLLSSKVGESDKCAEAMEDALKRAGMKGERITITSPDVNPRRSWSYSDRYGGNIGQGMHCGIRIRDKVYDNLNHQGLPYQEWLDDLHTAGQKGICVAPF